MKDSLLTRGVAEVIDLEHLQKRLDAGDKLRIKLGIDPSTPYLHIGHAVPLRKLRAFQDAGHTAVLIIGDYTAQIGDPTDRSAARVMLSPEEVKKNAESYLAQANLILDPTKTEVRYQSEWFGEFRLRTVIELLATATLNHMLSHETFAKRLKENKPLFMQELLYPFLQGYDSVAVHADVELGGMDQKFNVLMGRVVQRAHHQPEQDVMLFPYLPGIDGQAKMSKSLGNAINLTDTPSDMFGKIMSIPDSLIETYFTLATKLDDTALAQLKGRLNGNENPRDIKEELAQCIVGEFHSEDKAVEAVAEFDRVFRQKQAPEATEVLKLPPQDYDLIDILTSRTTLVASKSEARRLVAQGGVKKNQTTVHDSADTVSPADGVEVILQVGPRRFVRIEWKK